MGVNSDPPGGRPPRPGRGNGVFWEIKKKPKKNAKKKSAILHLENIRLNFLENSSRKPAKTNF